MASRSILLSAVVLGTLWNVGSPGCSSHDIDLGICNIEAGVTDTGANLEGEATEPGGSEAPDDESSEVTPCQPFLDGTCGRDTFTVTAPLTLVDIASFTPDPASASMEPNGWGIVGLPANFIGASGPEVHSGTLLGQPAEVRFTPVSWSWNYGDGTTARLDTPGLSWADLGVREFDPTPTSHVFETDGVFTVSLTVRYSAEYRVGTLPWTPIAGTVALAAHDLTVDVVDAQTVLVQRDCRANPSGPGC